MHNALTWTLGMLVVAAIVYMAKSMWDEKVPPTVIHSAAFNVESAAPGETVWVKVDRTRNRWCPGSVRQFWYQESTGRVFQGQTRPSSPHKDRVGRFTTAFEKTVPKELTAGTWCYAPQVLYQCNGSPYVLQQAVACLEVTP